MKVTLLVCFFAAIACTYALPLDGDEQVYESILDKIKLAPKYVKLIEKYGEKAWHFLECMGIDWAEHCVAPTVGCVVTKNIEGCIELIKCEGKDAVSCAAKLK